MRVTAQGPLAFHKCIVRRRGGCFLGLNALAAFNLEAPGELLEPGLAWQLLAKARGKNVLDLGIPKPRGEFLAAGACHAPGGAAVTSLGASIRLGSTEKKLLILGERRWTRRGDHFAELGDPAPFTAMPIVWERAFGGPAHPDNRLGAAHAALTSPDAQARVIMPNVEYPGSLLVSPGLKPFPAGFDAMRETRTDPLERMGSYDQAWLDTVWPGPPTDYDTELDCWAPPDQRVEGYFAGDEAVRIENMHPTKPVIESRLPGKRVRFFARTAYAPQSPDAVLEVAARLDTVWLFPELDRGVLVWRGLLAVPDEDATGVADLLAVSEDMGDQPPPAESYRALLTQAAPPQPSEPPASAPGQAGQANAARTQQAPAPKADAAQARPAARPQPDAPHAPPQPPPPSLAGILADMRAEMEQEFAKQGLSPSLLLKTPQETQTTLGALMDKSLAQAAGRLESMGLSPEALSGLTAAGNDYQAALGSAKQLSALLQTRVANLGQDVGKTLAAAEQPASRQALQAALGKLGLGPQAMGRLTKAADAISASLAQAEAAMAAAAPAPAAAPEPEAPPPPDAPPAGLSRQDAVRLRAAGRSLAGLDFCGADLSGLDLSRADLQGALLEHANLDNAALTGANLSGALLAGATARGAVLDKAACRNLSAPGLDAAGACLTGADLSRADLTGAGLACAKLTGANLEGATLEKADLSGAHLGGAQAGKANFTQARCAGAVFAAAQAQQADFTAAVLDQADFTGAMLVKARFTDTCAAQACFEDANMAQSRSTGGANFTRANFTGAVLDQAVWLEAVFEAATFEEARMNQARFDKSRMARACLARAVARGASLQKADLTGANLRGADLFQASFHAARLVACRFDQSNLFGANLIKALLAQATFKGADVGRTRLALRPPLDKPS